MLTAGPGRGQAAVSVDSLRVSRPPDSPRNIHYVAANLNILLAPGTQSLRKKMSEASSGELEGVVDRPTVHPTDQDFGHVTLGTKTQGKMPTSLRVTVHSGQPTRKSLRFPWSLMVQQPQPGPNSGSRNSDSKPLSLSFSVKVLAIKVSTKYVHQSPTGKLNCAGNGWTMTVTITGTIHTKPT